MSKVKCIGIIAEDVSDFETAKVLVKRMLNRENLSFKKKVGNGCGKLRRKALDYATDLINRGCDMLILIHDLDRNTHKELFEQLTEKIKTATINRKFICIPIEELEAWFLSDPKAIKETFNLTRQPRFNGQPESIGSPKEILEKEIYLCSNKSTIFINTKHNQKLAEKVSIDLLKNKCSSFSSLYDFITSYQYR